MEVVYILVAIAVVLAGVVLWAFSWSVTSGQFDDLDGPAHRILLPDDRARDNDTDKPR
jgi:cbb3-type cytochrome oxidase maturation protein